MSNGAIISRMRFFGHPLHPMLIHFPVAALMALAATDFAFLITADEFWARAGLWLAGVGAAGGWLSGLIGLIDLATVADIRRLVSAWCHAALAVMLLSLASCNWLLRLDDVTRLALPWGLALSLLSVVLIAATGYLGGRLVYEHAVGVNTE